MRCLYFMYICSSFCEAMKRMNMNLKVRKHVWLSFNSMDEVNGLYRSLQIDYPRFFKMDGLSKLGFLAAEMIFGGRQDRFVPGEDTAVICFNSMSSLNTDIQYQATIAAGDFFPSPSLFVYTLPNIAAGEIAIRNHFLGETAFYVCKQFDAAQMVRTTRNAFCNKTTTAAILAWLECFGTKAEVLMLWLDGGAGGVAFSEGVLNEMYGG